MRFDLVDRVVEQSDDSITTHKLVSAAEEYLGDHFPTFPVLPGVLMLEAMVQAARKLVEASVDPSAPPLVLGGVRALKYGTFVPPGHLLEVTVKLKSSNDNGSFDFEGSAQAGDPAAPESRSRAVAGKFTLRPVNLAPGS